MPDQDEIPFIAVGTDELTEDLGDSIHCPHCGEQHPIEYGKQQVGDEWVESKTLAFYSCGDKSYLAGINGKKFKTK